LQKRNQSLTLLQHDLIRVDRGKPGWLNFQRRWHPEAYGLTGKGMKKKIEESGTDREKGG
jgi:hypothetical protein